MKVALVVCNIDLVKHRRGGLMPRWESTYREGVASIGAFLRKHGTPVTLMRLSAGVAAETFGRVWDENVGDYDIAAFTANTVDFPEASRLAKILKARRPHVLTICGGIHPTLAPEACMEPGAFDMICRGEGEPAMLELCTKLQRGDEHAGIAGLWVRHNGHLHRNPVRPLLANLAELPPPARDLPTVTDYDGTLVKDNTFFLGTRGCPYKCTYCCNESIRNVFPNHKVYYRYKPVDSLIEELRTYLGHHPATRWLALYDDVMMGNRKWFGEFTERYQRDIGRASFLTGRWELLDEETIPWLRRLACKFLLVGVEVGDEQLRRQVLKRNQSDRLMLERAALLRKYRIHYGLYTMVGVPSETAEKALKTVKLAARLGGNQVLGHHTIFFPFEGTPLYERCVQEQLLGDRWVGSYFDDTRLDMPYFTREEILYARKRFSWFRVGYWLLNKLPRPLRVFLERYLDHLWLEGARRARRRVTSALDQNVSRALSRHM